jgi:hypothetical protein
MAIKVGAGLVKVGKAAARIVTAVPIRHHGLKMGMITPAVGRPGTIVVDNHGHRYNDETLVTRDPSRYFFYKEAVHFDIRALEYDRTPSWLIFDDELRAAGPLTYLGISTAGYGFIPWTEDNLDAVKRGWILSGKTLEELAGKIRAHGENRKQMDVKALVDQVAMFNKFCAEGKDEQCDRNPRTMKPVVKAPFYALPLYPGGPNTKGGIAANAQREVLDWEGKPIPHLFTAGEISSAFKFVYQGGGNLTECLVFGRVAGRTAAAQKAIA